MILAWMINALILSLAAAEHLVWPPPQHLSAEGPPLALASNFAIHASLSDAGNGFDTSLAERRLADAVARYHSITTLIAPPGVRAVMGPAVSMLRVFVASSDVRLTFGTKYDYELSILENGTARAVADSIYGAMYALETFVQLIGRDGRLSHNNVHVRDGPQYQWRGLMIDAGRRFFPMDTVRNLMDTMAANKLNVLHLHASDMCRFGVESKLFPNLTASLTGIRAGFYSQQDIKDMISYAGARGIRVVPEFDIPGHSHGFIALEKMGVKFCSQSSMRSQLHGDPENTTYDVLAALFKEMAGLFEDEVFNIGCDETTATGPCTVESTAALETKLFKYISSELGKTPAAWEEALFDAQAATPNTIIDSWTGARSKNITKTGRRSIESSSGNFYFTSPAPGGPKGWSQCWYEIDTGVPETEKHLLLGGEMSMWSDTYCYIEQCGTHPGSPPVGHELFDPNRDTDFGHSIGGMIWPRGYVAAASFWNFNKTVDPASNDFTAAIWRLNDHLASRGSWVCPSNCSCDQLTTCGKPYINQKPQITVV